MAATARTLDAQQADCTPAPLATEPKKKRSAPKAPTVKVAHTNLRVAFFRLAPGDKRDLRSSKAAPLCAQTSQGVVTELLTDGSLCRAVTELEMVDQHGQPLDLSGLIALPAVETTAPEAKFATWAVDLVTADTSATLSQGGAPAGPVEDQEEPEPRTAGLVVATVVCAQTPSGQVFPTGGLHVPLPASEVPVLVLTGRSDDQGLTVVHPTLGTLAAGLLSPDGRTDLGGLRAPINRTDIPQAVHPDDLLVMLSDVVTGNETSGRWKQSERTVRYGLSQLRALGLLRRDSRSIEDSTPTAAGIALAALRPDEQRVEFADRIRKTLCAKRYQELEGDTAAGALSADLVGIEERLNVKVTLRGSTSHRRAQQMVIWADWSLAEAACQLSAAERQAHAALAAQRQWAPMPVQGTRGESEEMLTRRVEKLLLARVRHMHHRDFEWLVGHLLSHEGLEQVEVTRACGDGGVDATAQTPAGHGQQSRPVLVQAKRYQGNVGVGEVRQLRGTGGEGAIRVFITSGGYAAGARTAAVPGDSRPVRLIDGAELARMLVTHMLGAENTGPGEWIISDLSEFHEDEDPMTTTPATACGIDELADRAAAVAAWQTTPLSGLADQGAPTWGTE